MEKFRYFADLQLFADEGAMADSAETGDLAADAEQMNAKDCEKEFGELIAGKFKEQFTKKTQEIINKRFKETKSLEDYKSRVSPIIGAIMEKYGIAEGDEQLLLGKLKRESSPQAQEQAPKSGVDTKGIQKNALQSRIGQWMTEGEMLKESYPDFDLRNELHENKVFGRLLLGGVPLKTAYETVHQEEILTGAMAYTADEVRRQVTRSIETKGRRPMENGISSGGGVVSSVDVNSLTANDILKILKQVENGANITF